MNAPQVSIEIVARVPEEPLHAQEARAQAQDRTVLAGLRFGILVDRALQVGEVNLVLELSQDARGDWRVTEHVCNRELGPQTKSPLHLDEERHENQKSGEERVDDTDRVVELYGSDRSYGDVDLGEGGSEGLRIVGGWRADACEVAVAQGQSQLELVEVQRTEDLEPDVQDRSGERGADDEDEHDDAAKSVRGVVGEDVVANQLLRPEVAHAELEVEGASAEENDQVHEDHAQREAEAVEGVDLGGGSRHGGAVAVAQDAVGEGNGLTRRVDARVELHVRRRIGRQQNGDAGPDGRQKQSDDGDDHAPRRRNDAAGSSDRAEIRKEISDILVEIDERLNLVVSNERAAAVSERRVVGSGEELSEC